MARTPSEQAVLHTTLERTDRGPGPASIPPDCPTAPPPPPSTARAPERTRLPYLPALDGLRGVAVAAVFLFHGGVGWMSGGYLGVSTFFTLSGFLITALLLAERRSQGRVALGRFWERRIRRLLPAALLGVVLAAVVTTLVGNAAQRRALAGDGVATLFDVANWRFVVEGRSYSALFTAPSPLQHAWSLAIEAQFYWLYPLLLLGLLRLVRGRRSGLGVALALLTAASLAVTRFGGFGHDRIYYGTDTRAAELLIGALLAVVLVGRAGGVGGTWSTRGRRWIGLAGTVAGLALVASWVLAPRDAAFIDAGALGPYAVITAVVVLAATVPASAPARVLGLRPLRELGRISYGVYLFHWPLLIFFSPARVPGPPIVRLTLAAATTLALAAVSYRLVEQPIRTRQGWLGTVPLRRAVPIGLAVAVSATFLVASGAEPPTAIEQALAQPAGTSFSDADRLGRPPPDAEVVPAQGATAEVTPEPVTDDGLAPPAFVTPSRPLRVLVVGDSTALSLAPLLDEWGRRNGVWTAASAAVTGCGILRSAQALNAYFPEPYDHCAAWATDWPPIIEEVDPDVVVLSTGFWEGTDRMFAGDPGWHRPGDPVYDDALRRDFGAALDLLAAEGAPVAWLDHPPSWFNEESPFPLGNPQVYDPWRLERVDEIQQELVGSRGGVGVVPTRRFFDAWPGGTFDPTLRPDGLHIDGEGARPLVEWLGPAIVSTYWSVSGHPEAARPLE